MGCATPRKMGTLVTGHLGIRARVTPLFLANVRGVLSRLTRQRPQRSAQNPLFRLTSAVEGVLL